MCGVAPVSPTALCGNATSTAAAASLSDSVTAFVTSSPRHRDCTNAIVSLLTQIRTLLPSAPVVVVFDGLHPRLLNASASASSRSLKLTGDAAEIRRRYAAQIAAVRQHPAVLWPRASRVVVHTRWLHKGGALREAMQSCRTPLVFVLEEDVQLVEPDTIQTQMIMELLLCDSGVEYVQLYWGDRLDEYMFGTPTFGAHRRQSGLLNIHRWSDRPHFARLEMYSRIVFPLFARHLHSTIETELIGRFGHGQSYNKYGLNISQMRSWGMWLYAPSGCMRHERHHECGRYPNHRNRAYGR